MIHSPAAQNAVFSKSGAAVSVPADTSEDALATISIPAGVMGANGMVRVKTYWTLTANANSKTGRVRFNGISGTAYMSIDGATVAFLIVETVFFNRNATNSQGGATWCLTSANGANDSTAVVTSAVDTTAATSIVITGQKASAGDTMTLECWSVELFP